MLFYVVFAFVAMVLHPLATSTSLYGTTGIKFYGTSLCACTKDKTKFSPR